MSLLSATSPFHRRSYAEIDMRRIRENFLFLRSRLPQTAFFCPMVKANAYGHGDVEVSRTLRSAGASHLGVGLIEEGIGLRLSGDVGALLLMGVFDPSSAHAVLDFELTPVISAWHQLESLRQERLKSEAAKGKTQMPVKVHFKFNTGMNRLGFEVEEAPGLRSWLISHPEFELGGICTHLLRGEDAGYPGGESEKQLIKFAQALEPFKDLHFFVHALNSSGLESLWSRVQKKLSLGNGTEWPLGARPGLAVYGLQAATPELRPALSLKSHLVMIHNVRQGERVSYGPSWTAPRDSVIGVVPLGYGDGYFRALSNKSSVLCRGERVPQVGTICMDYFMIDLTELAQKTVAGAKPVKPGEEIVLLGVQESGDGGGDEISAQELADLLGTIPYEILTNITERVPRVYLR